MRLVVSILLVFLSIQVSGQCPVADFTIATPACSGADLQITNNSVNAVSYSWDFSPGETSGTLQTAFFDTVQTGLPQDFTLAKQNDTLIAFFPSADDQCYYRAVFLNGPSQKPGDITLIASGAGISSPADIQFIKENGNWYGLAIDRSANNIIRLDFGSSLLNTPTVTEIVPAGISTLNQPRGMDIVTDKNGKIWAAVASFITGTVTMFDFGNSITNIPNVQAPFVVNSTTGIIDVKLLSTCNGVYAFVAGFVSGNIYRLDYGNSYASTPTSIAIYNNGYPADLIVYLDNSEWKIAYQFYNGNNFFIINLGTDPSNNSPVLENTITLPQYGPKGIAVAQEATGTYFLNAFSTLSQLSSLYYPKNNSVVNSVFSSDPTPANIRYLTPGSYNVTLTVKDNTGRISSTTQPLTLNPGANADFSFANTCETNQTVFTDLTTTSTPISGYNWDFSTGATSSAANTNYTFPAAGTYNVKLTVTAANGCISEKSRTVSIASKPTISFSITAGCSKSPVTINSTNSSNVVSWLWNFGNGDTSIAQTPQYTYLQGGDYLILASVVSDSGCTASSSNLVTINQRPISTVNIQNTCIGADVEFLQNTFIVDATITGYSWDFGDGNTSNQATDLHQYPNTVANYTATFIATADNGCADTVITPVKINNVPTASFTVDTSLVCEGASLLFNDNSSVTGDTISAWTWDFGDGTIENNQNPTHSFQTAGRQTVQLIVYSPSNCPSVPVQLSFNVNQKPSANFNYNGQCIGSPTTLIDQSTSPSGIISSHLWIIDLADSLTIANPTYTFADTGSHNIQLIVTSDNGCIDATQRNTVISPSPLSDFITATSCSNAATAFNNLSVPPTGSTITGYAWNFGDINSPQNTSAVAQPSHLFSSSGPFNVSLIVTTNLGCKDTSIKVVNVNQAPQAQFTYSPTCFGDLMSFFNPGNPLDSSYFWNFGDGQTNQLREPAHYYAFAGNYNVTLTVTASSGCSSTASRQVTVSPIPVANFSTPSGCVNSLYTLNDSSSISAGSITRFYWTVNNLSADSTINSSFLPSDTGLYIISHTVVSDIGCRNTKTKNVRIYSLPVANFTFNPQFGIPPLDVTFTDASSGANSFIWNFGDNSATSTVRNPLHTYSDTGVFVINQIAISQFGCRDTMDKNIYVIKPILDIAIINDSSYSSGGYFYPVVKLVNLGTRNIDSVSIEARLGNGAIIREEIRTTIPNGPGGILNYRFNAAFQSNTIEDNSYLCIKVSKPNGEEDNVPSNNEKCFSYNSDLTINLYPNPMENSGSLDVISKTDDPITINLFSSTSLKIAGIFEGKLNKGLTKIPLELPYLQSGMYYLQILYKDNIDFRPLMIIRR